MVNIELRPYDALGILVFLREYFNEENRPVESFTAMHETVDAYELEIYKKMTSDQVEDAILELQVNKLTKRIPKKPSG